MNKFWFPFSNESDLLRIMFLFLIYLEFVLFFSVAPRNFEFFPYMNLSILSFSYEPAKCEKYFLVSREIWKRIANEPDKLENFSEWTWVMNLRKTVGK